MVCERPSAAFGTPLTEGEKNAARPADGAAGAAGVAADPGGISLFQDVEKQLGLKLEKGTHPVSVVVIDHVEQKPTD